MAEQGSGLLRGETTLIFFLGELDGSVLPLLRCLGGLGSRVTLGPPVPLEPEPPCDRSCGSITYKDFWGAAATGFGPTLETPARIAAASILVRVIPEPSLSHLVYSFLIPFAWHLGGRWHD